MAENKDVAQRWLRAVATGDADTLRALMTSDAIWELKGTSVLAGTRDVDGLVELATQLNAAIEGDFVFDFLHLTAEDDRVAVEFTGTSTLVSGVAYNNEYHLLFHFSDGLINHIKEYNDSKTVDAAVAPLLAQAAGG